MSLRGSPLLSLDKAPARGLEREQVIRSFAEYLGRRRNVLDDEGAGEFSTGELGGDAGGEVDTETPELDFGGQPEEKARRDKPGAGAEGGNAAALTRNVSDRALANLFLRRFVNTGCLSEETLSGYSRVINITPLGAAFF